MGKKSKRPPAQESPIGIIDPALPRQWLEQLRNDVDFLFHEIRTPLTAVIGCSEFLQKHDLPAAERGALLEIIRKEGLRIDGLLTDFSKTCRREEVTWLSEMTLTPVIVEDLLLEVAARFKSSSPIHTIRVELSQPLPLVMGDQKKLDLVLRNLIANAIKYSPAGGLIDVSATDTHDQVIVCVSDHGIGIPPEYLHRVFDRNFRLPPPGQENPRGSGLGLAMVEKIVACHGGQVRVESELGRGSSFFFTLPSAPRS